MGRMTGDYEFQRAFKEVVVTGIIKVEIFLSPQKCPQLVVVVVRLV